MNKKSLTILTALSLAVFCAGCVAVWGKSYNVAMANSRSVVIEYDPMVANVPAMLQAAQASCDQYKKDAVLSNVTGGNMGIRVNTYKCETRKADKVIDVQ